MCTLGVGGNPFETGFCCVDDWGGGVGEELPRPLVLLLLLLVERSRDRRGGAFGEPGLFGSDEPRTNISNMEVFQIYFDIWRGLKLSWFGESLFIHELHITHNAKNTARYIPAYIYCACYLI